MGKLFFLVLSLFSNLIKEEDYQLIQKEASTADIVYISDVVSLTGNNDNGYQLVIDEATISIDGIDVKIDVSDIINITYFSSQLIHEAYSLTGELIKKQVLLNDPLIDYDIKYFNETLYVAGVIGKHRDIANDRVGLDKNDCILIKANNMITIKLYGGKQNEGFNKIVIHDNFIYAAGIKDGLGDGDFAGAGIASDTAFIVKLSQSLEIIDTLFIKQSAVQVYDFNIIDDTFILTTASFIVTFDKMLKIESSLVEAFNYTIVGKSGLITSRDDKLIIINSNLKKVKEILIGEHKVKFYSNGLLLEDDNIMIVDVVDVKSMEYFEKYNPNENKITINTVLNDAVLINESSNPTFNPLVYGKYDFTYTFLSNNTIAFDIIRTKHVELEYNVVDGGVYPLDYRLAFTGLAKLNNNQINVNYALSNAGEYVLELESINGEQKIINFEVRASQIEFIDATYKKYAQDVAINKDYNISFNIEATNEITFDYVIVDQEKQYDITYISPLLTLTLPKITKPGIVTHTITEIGYTHLGKKGKYKMNMTYTVNVPCESPTIACLYEDSTSLKINCDVNDVFQCSRYIVIDVMNEDYHQQLKLPLCSQTLKFSDLDEGVYVAKINLAYNTNTGVHQLLKIGEIKFSNSLNNIVGNIDVRITNDVLEKIIINLDEGFKTSQLLSLALNDEVVYQSSVKGFDKYIFYGIIGGVIGFIVIYIIRSFRYKKKQKI